MSSTSYNESTTAMDHACRDSLKWMFQTYADSAQESRQSSVAGVFKSGDESSNCKEQCHYHDDNVCLLGDQKSTLNSVGSI